MRKRDVPTLTRAICDGAMSIAEYARIGWFFVHRARRHARDAGTFQAARNLRKRGVPLTVALRILSHRGRR